jgi:hypothetical protein
MAMHHVSKRSRRKQGINAAARFDKASSRATA